MQRIREKIHYASKHFSNQALAESYHVTSATRAGLHCTLKRHNVSNLNTLLLEVEDTPKSSVKCLKGYPLGFIHVDVKYLPQIPDETQRRYLFVAINRASRWVYLRELYT